MLEKEAEYDRHTGFLTRQETIGSVSVAVSNSQGPVVGVQRPSPHVYVIHTQPYTDLGFEFHIRSIHSVVALEGFKCVSNAVFYKILSFINTMWKSPHGEFYTFLYLYN